MSCARRPETVLIDARRQAGYEATMSIIFAAAGRDGYVVASDSRRHAPDSTSPTDDADQTFELCSKYLAASAGLSEVDGVSVRDLVVRRRGERSELNAPDRIADDLAEHLVGLLNATKSVEAVELVLVGDRRGPSGFRIQTKNDEPGTYAVTPRDPATLKAPYLTAGDGSATGGAQLGVHKFMGAKDRTRMLKQLPENALVDCARQTIAKGVAATSKTPSGADACGGDPRVLYRAYA